MQIQDYERGRGIVNIINGTNTKINRMKGKPYRVRCIFFHIFIVHVFRTRRRTRFCIVPQDNVILSGHIILTPD